jgi:DnaJ-class molecular chaperone
MLNNPFKILNLPDNSSIEEVKKAYKKIALNSHPDKLNNIKDEKEKNKKIKYFMDATNAYKKLLNEEVEFEDDNWDYNDWMNSFNDFTNSNLFKGVVDVIKKMRTKIKKHSISVDIKYQELFSPNKKKLRIFLRKLDEPIYINLDCSKYPSHTINYFDDNDDEHEIMISMDLINDKIINNGFYHIDMDIYLDLNIDLCEYLNGGKKTIEYFNNEMIEIDIQPFTFIHIIKNKGIKSQGDLIIKFNIKPIEKEKWYELLDADKKIMIEILSKIKMI